MTQQAIRLYIPGTPTGQKRVQAVRRGEHAGVHKDEKQKKREDVMLAQIAAKAPGEPLTGPLELGVYAYLPIPASKPKKWQAAARAGLMRPTKKPDLSNAIKNIEDVMTMAGFWTDDKLIVGYLPGTGKYYSDNPHWLIVVQPWVPKPSGGAI
ncbi:Holliday junction resolvase RusA (prophage-encoded endonuclease) [Humidesulfovibrio mexicanus]|uniref:Holliday junction resolvase RusA (Prophage-encoded endonuclease) n=1 Tax=Humidesulfovibrio mexicanus TaxID=147047 RepID=A0A239AV90_9BACT|nr:RusA family crossover junction endodeoxyribonuclease [Humidesulfovibrio mexicanus]SNR99251.1 Holliday junction resolvase RusA (prophage-encoded endonuclease) [Humidesulfovibrio mexicanus]